MIRNRPPFVSSILFRVFWVYIIVTLLIILTIEYRQITQENSHLLNVRSSTEDNCITISWDIPDVPLIRRVEIQVSDSTGLISDVVVPAKDAGWCFTQGTHGTSYSLCITEFLWNGQACGITTFERMFVSYERTSGIPTLIIRTDSGSNPSADIIHAPEGAISTSITNNPYEKGSMWFIGLDSFSESLPLKIRVRGNMSSAGSEKKAYRFVLEQEADLLQLGNSHAARSWVLLKSGNTLSTISGTYLAQKCGMEWITSCTYVNLILNGDWRGLYLLSETVNQECSRGTVQQNGFIIENDAYWWAQDGPYFRADGQPSQYAFTFKYPNNLNSEDARYLEIQDYTRSVFGDIYACRSDALNYIDETSFVKRLIVLDLSQCADPGGTNMYFYMNEFDAENPASCQLKTGPIWDFDGCFTPDIRAGRHVGWSLQHHHPYTYYPSLLKMESFRSLYCRTWFSLSANLEDDFNAWIDENCLKKEGLAESRDLDAIRWQGRPATSLGQDVEYYRQYIHDSIVWISQTIFWDHCCEETLPLYTPTNHFTLGG